MYRNFARYNWKRMAHLQPYVFQKYLSGNFYFFLLALTKMQNFIQNSTPMPIKDAASIQKLFFQPFTIVHFDKFFLILLFAIKQSSIKHTCFWVIFFG